MMGALIGLLVAVLLILFGLCGVVSAAAWLPDLIPAGKAKASSDPGWRKKGRAGARSTPRGAARWPASSGHDPVEGRQAA
jgi:hypothetical protein